VVLGELLLLLLLLGGLDERLQLVGGGSVVVVEVVWVEVVVEAEIVVVVVVKIARIGQIVWVAVRRGGRGRLPLEGRGRARGRLQLGALVRGAVGALLRALEGRQGAAGLH